MAGKIFQSILSVAIAVLLAVLIIMLGILYPYFDSVQVSQLKDELSLAADATEQIGIRYLEGLDYNRYRLTWVDSDGTVMFDSHADAGAMENHRDREEIKEALASGNGRSIRWSSTLTEQTVYEAVRLEDGSILRISVRRATALLLVLDMLGPIVIVLLIAIAFSAWLAHRMAKKVVEPLNRLDLEKPLENEVYEELSPLLQRIYVQHMEIKDQAVNAEKHRQEFTANVSHELKTPLQSIIGSAELLENGIVKEEDVPRFVGHIRQEASRLVVLIDDIIRLSQLDEGAEMPREDVSLKSLSEEVCDTLTDAAKLKDVSLEVSGDDGLVHGVRRLLYEVIYNLCDNAIKYNNPGGSVKVNVDQKPGKVLLSVQDTGIGIAPEYRDKVFERFYRVDKSHSKQSGGTGLGLSIVKHAVQYHHGKIEIESELNKGTTIVVLFDTRA